MIKLKNYFHVAEKFFSDDFCDDVIEKIENGPYVKTSRDAEFRVSDVIFFPHDENTNWIYEPLEKLVEEVKSKNWRTFKFQFSKFFNKEESVKKMDNYQTMKHQIINNYE